MSDLRLFSWVSFASEAADERLSVVNRVWACWSMAEQGQSRERV